MMLFCFGFLAGVVATFLAAVLIVGDYLAGIQRGLGRVFD